MNPSFQERWPSLWKYYMRERIMKNPMVDEDGDIFYNSPSIEDCIKFKYRYGHPIRGWFRPGPDNTLADRKDYYNYLFVEFFDFEDGDKYKNLLAHYKKDFDKYFNTHSDFRQKVLRSKVPRNLMF